MQKVTTFLWFNNQAEEAVKFYTAVFKNSKILGTTYYPKSTEKVSGQKAGTVMTVAFELNGQHFVAMNGGPQFPFTPAISLVVNCDTQEEIDYYWDKLTADGGEPVECGWLKDKFGLSWQITPSVIWNLIADPARTERVMAKVITMKKLNLAELKAA